MPQESDRLAIHGGRPVRTHPLAWELPGTHWMGNEELTLVESVIRARSPFRYYGPNVLGMANQLETVFRDRCARRWALAVGTRYHRCPGKGSRISSGNKN